MGHRIIKNQGGSYHIEGRGHSWGSFASRSEANTFIEKVAADDQAFRESQKVRRAEMYVKFAEQDAEWAAARRARMEADRLLYEGRS